MQYVPRHVEAKLVDAARKNGLVVLYGPRKVGKLSILKRLFPNHRVIKFNPVYDVEGARRDPQSFLENQRGPLILHNIHYASKLIPHLLDQISKANNPGQYIITSLHDLPGLNEPLDEVFSAINMGSLSFEEILGLGMRRHWLDAYLASPQKINHLTSPIQRNHESMIHYLWRGGMPGLLGLSDKEVLEKHYTYLQVYAEADARCHEPVYDLAAFGRFLSILARHSAKNVDLQAISMQTYISIERVQSWLEVLYKTYQWHQLVHINDRDALGPKRSYSFCRDSGIMAALLGISSPFSLAINPNLNNTFKTWCHNDLLRRVLSLDGDHIQQWHWNDGDKHAVSLVLEFEGKLYPIDIQCITHATSKDGAGLRAFQKAFGDRAQHGILLYAGKTVEKVGRSFTAIPWNAEMKRL